MSEAEVLFALQVRSSLLILVELPCSVVRLSSSNFFCLQNRTRSDSLNNETGDIIFKRKQSHGQNLYVTEI